MPDTWSAARRGNCSCTRNEVHPAYNKGQIQGLKRRQPPQHMCANSFAQLLVSVCRAVPLRASRTCTVDCCKHPFPHAAVSAPLANQCPTYQPTNLPAYDPAPHPPAATRLPPNDTCHRCRRATPRHAAPCHAEATRGQHLSPLPGPGPRSPAPAPAALPPVRPGGAAPAPAPSLPPPPHCLRPLTAPARTPVCTRGPCCCCRTRRWSRTCSAPAPR